MEVNKMLKFFKRIFKKIEGFCISGKATILLWILGLFCLVIIIIDKIR